MALLTRAGTQQLLERAREEALQYLRVTEGGAHPQARSQVPGPRDQLGGMEAQERSKTQTQASRLRVQRAFAGNLSEL